MRQACRSTQRQGVDGLAEITRSPSAYVNLVKWIGSARGDALIAPDALFAIGKGFGGDPDLHDPRLVHPSDTHIFEDSVIDFALAAVLDNNFLVAAE